MQAIRNRSLIRVLDPATEPLTLGEAKLYLRVDSSSDDTLISDLITAARMTAEDWLKRSLITQTWQLSYDGIWPQLFGGDVQLSRDTAPRYPFYSEVPIRMGPVVSISSVTALNIDGTSQTIAPASYYLNAAHSGLIFTTWTSAFRMQIVYVAGYGNAVDVPKPIKQGMLAHIAALYDNRGADGDFALPEQTIRLYMAYREVRL